MAGEPWIDPRVSRPRRGARRRRRPGWPATASRPVGLPWQEPDGGFAGSRAAPTCTPSIDTEGRTDDRRADFDTVYGDWDVAARRHASPRAGRLDSAGSERPLDERIDRASAAARAAEADPGNLTDEHALTLMTAEGDAARRRSSELADDLRRETVGDEVTYVVNRNINFTNVCYIGCRFCAFAQRRTDADAYSLSLDQVADRAEEAWGLGATEVCMQGGIDPELPGTAYFDLAAAVKQRVPEMHVHAFSPDGDRQRRVAGPGCRSRTS